MAALKTIIQAAGLIIAGLLTAGQLVAQDTANFVVSLEKRVIASTGKSGGVAGPNGFSISYTVGEPVISTQSLQAGGGIRNIITQGFQQPSDYTFEVKTDKKDDMILYPNPTTTSVTMRYTVDSGTTKIDIRILNNVGQLMYTTKWLAPDPIKAATVVQFDAIDVSRFVTGLYFVSLIMDNGFKVTKKFIKM